jgi:hypothetical protein
MIGEAPLFAGSFYEGVHVLTAQELWKNESVLWRPYYKKAGCP